MFDIYTACLSNGILHRRAALQLELSVGLCVAHDLVGDPVLGRVTLVNVYASVGYDCLTPDGADYKTINRRVNAAFLLFEKVGSDKVARVVRGTTGHRRVEAVQGMLEPLKLYVMADVFAYCGRPRQAPAARAERQSPTPTSHPARRAIDREDITHVRTEHIDIPIPPDVTRVELMQLASELIKLADTFNDGRVARRRPGRARRDTMNA